MSDLKSMDEVAQDYWASYKDPSVKDQSVVLNPSSPNAAPTCLPEIKEESFHLVSQIRSLMDENARLNAEVVRLNHEISALRDSRVEKLIPSNEQLICEMQINKLMEAAANRELTLEETKRLDLLVKNLYLSKEKTASVPTTFKTLPAILEAKLLEIASTPDPQLASD